MAYRHSHDLPEVVPDSSPQALTYVESYERRGLNEGDPKYAVIHDPDTAKIAANSDPVIIGGSDGRGGETPTSPAPAYRPPLQSAAAVAAAGDGGDTGRSEAGLASEKGGERKILGLKKRTFFIVLVIAAIVIAAAAIGGGVGGSRAAKKNSNNADSAGAAEDETPSTSPNDSGDASRTQDSPSLTPTPTSDPEGGSDNSEDDDDKKDDDKKDDDNKEDDDDSDDSTVADQGFDFTGWQDRDFKGNKTDIITTTGFVDLPFNVTSYKWRPNGTSCCVTMCQGNTTNVGWRCTTFDRDESSARFGRVFIGCGVEGLEENSRCS